jgi:hypothetical protein
MFDERESLQRGQICGHGIVCFLILTGIFAVLEQFFQRSIADAMFECLILTCVVYVMMRGEMMVRNVLVSRLEKKPMANTFMLGILTFNLGTLAFNRLENGEHFIQNGALGDVGAFAVIAFFIFTLMIFEIIWAKKQAKLFRNENEFLAQDTPEEQKNGEESVINPAVERKSRQIIDEREQRIRYESYPWGFFVTFFVFFIHSALKTLGIIWAPEFFAFCILAVCCVTILLIIIIARGGFSTRIGIFLPLYALINGLLILSRALRDILSLQEPWWTKDGLSGSACYGILGIIFLLWVPLCIVRMRHAKKEGE